jgi:hypothetical protein
MINILSIGLSPSVQGISMANAATMLSYSPLVGGNPTVSITTKD